MVALHLSVELADAVQGGGFGREFGRWLEDWYRASGVHRIELETAKVGGYAWHDYDWLLSRGDAGANAMLGQLRAELRRARADAEALSDALSADKGDDRVDVAALLDAHRASDPADLLEHLREQIQAAESILDRAYRHPAARSPCSTAI